MNSETADTGMGMGTGTGSTGSMGSGSGMGGTGGAAGTQNVQRMAQKAHDAVDRVEQTLTSGTERMMNWQQEYGEIAREQIRANPLAMIAGAFAVGYLFAKITR